MKKFLWLFVTVFFCSCIKVDISYKARFTSVLVDGEECNSELVVSADEHQVKIMSTYGLPSLFLPNSSKWLPVRCRIMIGDDLLEVRVFPATVGYTHTERFYIPINDSAESRIVKIEFSDAKNYVHSDEEIPEWTDSWTVLRTITQLGVE